jgi:serine/threonine protein kinase
MGDDLRFVKACLSVDPAKRPTTKDLLKHSYLSLEEHSILRKYENALLQESSNHISEESKQSVSS